MKLSLKPILTRKHLASFLALLVTIIMLSLTSAYLYSKNAELTKRHERAFDDAVEYNYNVIGQQLSEMEVVLRGVKGYMESSELVTQKEYHDYISALALEDRLSGFQGIAVATSVSNQMLPKHLKKVRQNSRPNYQIKPSGQRDEYAPISYIDPYVGDNIKAVGFDLLTNPLVRPAL